jgi:diguanylate cyclase (GGDEF)-like protein/PAS domain S-box-containing protein
MLAADRLRALVDLSRTLSSSLDLKDVLRSFTAHAITLTGASGTAVSMWDRERDLLVTLTDYEAHVIGEIADADSQYALADFPASLAVMTEQQAEIVRVADPAADPAERALLEQSGYRTLLMLPLVSRGDSVGLLEIVDVADREWSEHDLEFFHSLADIVGPAVHTALLNEQQREAEARYRSLVEHLPAVTYVDVAGTGDPVYVSPQLQSLMGVPVEEWTSGPDGWVKRMHPDDLFAADRYRDAVESGESYSAEYRLIDVDGRVRWFRDDAAPVRDASGAARFMQGVIFEVTDQKESEALLLESEQRFRELLENVRLAAITTDLDGRIVFVNEYFAELSGWWDDELIGRSWQETFVAGEGSETERAFLTELAQGHVIPHREGAILTRTRETRLFSWNATPLRDGDGTVTGSAWIGEDITDRRKAEQELARLAYHDSLTGLPNRILFQEHLELALARAERTGTGVAVLYVDLDDFKLVNDSFGHGAGDQLLCEVANRLRLSTRSSDVVARQGGDEFLILIADVDVEDTRTLDIGEVARKVAEEVREAVSRPMVLAETEIYTSASLGISLWPIDANDATSLLKHADIAMYKAKESGRDQYQLFTSTGRDPRAQLSMAGRLRGAVERDELMLYYQPIVALQSGEIVGAEALLRWQDGERGVVMPGEFIPLAERTGLIAGLSDWVIEEACRQGARWREAGIDVYISVNLPAIFWQPTAMRQVLETIESFGLSAERMMIEITESTVMADALRSEPIIAELHERGLRLAIDDFGTGHSSLSRLNQMQVTTLKIDRSFISDLPADRSAAVLVTSIVQLAKNLGLQPLAEGIETEEQHAFLVARGCPLGQGFLFSKAVPAEQMERLYLARRQAA